MTYYKVGWLASVLVVATSAQAMDPEYADVRKKFLAAKNSEEAGRHLHSMLKAVGANLGPVLEDDDASIALFAAWEKTRRAVKKNADGSEWHWLLGYFQGRMGVEPSRRWQAMLIFRLFWRGPDEVKDKLLRIYTKPPQVIVEQDGGFRFKDPGSKPIQKADMWTRQSILLARADNGSLTITSADGLKVTVSGAGVNEAINKGGWDRNLVTTHIGPDRSLVAIHDDYGEGYSLLCAETKSGKVIWKANIWAAGAEQVPARSGPWYHVPVLEISADKVLVYGYSPGAYMECLDLKTGRHHFRFSDTAWYSITD